MVWLEHAADFCHPSCLEVKNEESFICTVPICLRRVVVVTCTRQLLTHGKAKYGSRTDSDSMKVYTHRIYAAAGPLNPCCLRYTLMLAVEIFIYLSSFLTAVAVFRKPKAIPLCFSIDLVLNFLLSWLLVLLQSTFFLDVLFSFSPSWYPVHN